MKRTFDIEKRIVGIYTDDPSAQMIILVNLDDILHDESCPDSLLIADLHLNGWHIEMIDQIYDQVMSEAKNLPGTKEDSSIELAIDLGLIDRSNYTTRTLGEIRKENRKPRRRRRGPKNPQTTAEKWRASAHISEL